MNEFNINMFGLTVHQYGAVTLLIMFIKEDDFVEAGWKYFLLIDNHTPNQSGFSRSCRAHYRNEAMRLSANGFNHCFVSVEYGPSRLPKMLICLLSASKSVRKVIQKTTRIRITKCWIKITSNDRSSFTFSRQQKFRLNGGRSWLFSSKTNRSKLHWEMFGKSGSSTTCCSFFQANVTVITTRTTRFHVVHGKGWQVFWTRCLCRKNPTVFHGGKFQMVRKKSHRRLGIENFINVQYKKPEIWPNSMLFLKYFSVVNVWT